MYLNKTRIPLTPLTDASEARPEGPKRASETVQQSIYIGCCYWNNTRRSLAHSVARVNHRLCSSINMIPPLAQQGPQVQHWLCPKYKAHSCTVPATVPTGTYCHVRFDVLPPPRLYHQSAFLAVAEA